MKSTHLWLVLIGFHNLQIFPDRTSRAWSADVRSQSLSSESAVKYPHVGPTSVKEMFKYSPPRENTIGQMPYPRANKDNQIPTPSPASPPASFTLIGA